MANDASLKPSLFVQTLVPELDEDSFLNFLKAYYEWLQSTRLTFTSKVGNFSVGETIVGDTTKAKAIVKEIGTTHLVLKMLTDTPFDLNETFDGQTSSATATVVEIKDNVIRASARSQKNRDPDKSVDKYFEYLKGEFNKGFPTVSETDRRLISNKLKDFYQSKSNEDAYRFLFRAVYDSEIEFRYPGEEILRVSDGDFEKTTVVRAVPSANIFDYLNQTIVGQTSEALGNVVDIKITFLGGIRFAELTLKLVSGTFVAGETIYLLDDPTETTTLYGIVAGTTIVDAGSGYAIGDVLTITGDGAEAEAQVSSVSLGPINRIKVNAIGHGYQLGALATVVNTSTGGTGFSVKVSEIANTYIVTSGANNYTVGEVTEVSVVNRGSSYFKAPTVTLDDSVIKSLGLLSENLITIANGGSGYSVGDALVFTGGAGANAAGIVASVGSTAPYGSESLLFEDGTRVLQDNTVNGKPSALKNEDWTNLGSILRVELTNFGDGYTESSLPTITVTSSGSSANLIATDIQGNSANVEVDVANNAVGLGAIREIEILNFGIDYSNATIDATGVGDGNANVQAVISGIATSAGTFLTDDGKVSYKILQDSLFYQDFSYVIRSGLVFNAYRELVKQSVHPAGLQFFGEILISSYILASAQFSSVISIEKEEVEVIIKQILSFFPGGVNPTASVVEKEIVPVKTSAGLLNEFREINVEINPLFDMWNGDSTGEDHITKELTIFTSPSLVDVTQSNDREIVVKTTETANVALGQVVSKTKFDLTPSISVPIANETEVVVNVESPSSIAIVEAVTSPKIEIVRNLNLYPFDPVGVNVLTFGDLAIATFANTQISVYQSRSFDDSYGTRVVRTNTKVAGTVTISGNTVVGTGTSFNTDFLQNDYFIVNDEKFIVKSVANSTHLTLNVNPTGTYTGVSAYKELLV